ncbi:MAG: ABC transporter permease, partial [Chloroflexi bacterium]|nr:ABC transporter permease [Chloroflexota bacterium]
MAKVRLPVVEELLRRSRVWHFGALVALLYLLSPLVFCLLTSVADSTTIETPLSAGFSLRWYVELAGDPRWRAGLLNSLLVAGLTIPLALVCGTGAAIAFERHDFPGRTVVGTLVLAPLFVPPVTLGMQSLAFHQRVGLWGSIFSLALAHTLWATPVVFTLMRAVLASLDPRLEVAAQGLGATPLRAFLLITLPQLVPGLVTAAFLTFILSLNELVMTMFLATPRTQTLPTLIWPLVRSNVTPVVAAASSVT